MFSILFVYGSDKSWAIGNRVRFLQSQLQGKYKVEKCLASNMDLLCHTFDIVHAHSITYCPIPKKLIGGIWGFSLVSYRSLSVSREKNNKEAFDKTNFIVTKCPALLEYAYKKNRRIYGRKEVFIPNGTDPKLFCPRTYRIGWCGNKNLYSIKYKGVNIIRWAVDSINQDGIIRVEFVQDPSTADTILPQCEIAKFYQGLDVFVSASLYEGCSNVILEALSAGIPVVCTKTGIYQELLPAGVIAVDRTACAIKMGILQALEPAIRRRKFIQEKFSWEIVAQQYIDLYTDLGYPPENPPVDES